MSEEVGVEWSVVAFWGVVGHESCGDATLLFVVIVVAVRWHRFFVRGKSRNSQDAGGVEVQEEFIAVAAWK